jgi:hypothetical protein
MLERDSLETEGCCSLTGITCATHLGAVVLTGALTGQTACLSTTSVGSQERASANRVMFRVPGARTDRA